jgi:hypothetical protein
VCGRTLSNSDLLRRSLRRGLWERHRQQPVFHACLDLRILDILRKLQSSGPFAISTFADSITRFLVLRGNLVLCRDGHTTIVDVDGDIFLFQSWELECRCNGV